MTYCISIVLQDVTHNSHSLVLSNAKRPHVGKLRKEGTRGSKKILEHNRTNQKSAVFLIKVFFNRRRVLNFRCVFWAFLGMRVENAMMTYTENPTDHHCDELTLHVVGQIFQNKEPNLDCR